MEVDLGLSAVYKAVFLSLPAHEYTVLHPSQCALYKMAILSQSLVKLIQLATRVLQWCSVVIVMGITSYFINKGPHGQHIIYQEIIVRFLLSSMSLKLTCIVNHVRRLLPASLYLAVFPYQAGPICLFDRCDIFILVRLGHLHSGYFT